MNHAHPALAPDGVRPCGAMVTPLHPQGADAAASVLMRGWGPAMPMAALFSLPLASDPEVEQAWDTILHGLDQHHLSASRLVLVGVAGAQDAALQLAYSPVAAGCAGVLALGDGLPPLVVLGGQPVAGRPKLRLAWTADDPLFCAAALGDLLRSLRVAGLDAQGAVLARPDPAVAGLDTGFPSPALVRLGGAYLAELVAVALGGHRAKPKQERGP